MTTKKYFKGFSINKGITLLMCLLFNSLLMAQNDNQYKIDDEKNFSEALFFSSKGASQNKVIKISSTEELELKIQKKEGSTEEYFVSGTVVNTSFNIIRPIFTIQKKNGKVSGKVVFNDDKRALKISTNSLNEVVINESSIHDYICVMPKIHKDTSLKNEAPEEKFSGNIIELQSLPGAEHVIYLDFDGEYVVFDDQTIDAKSWGWDNDKIAKIWETVAQDYAPFKINVTTSRAVYDATPKNKSTMAIFTPTDTIAPGTGGWAWLGSFTYTDAISNCWVFNSDTAGAAANGSHEVGHVMGLKHDGKGSSVYYNGHSNWAPIMGFSGTRNRMGHWSKGEYADANNLEDDLKIITKPENGFGYKTDQHGDGMNNATQIISDAVGNVSADKNKGLISTPTDKDMFSFTTTGGVVDLDVKPTSEYTNLNIKARLLNDKGQEVLNLNTSGEMSAKIDFPLYKGTYYLEIDGAGEGANPSVGYSDYSSLGYFTISGKYAKGNDINDTQAPLPPKGLRAFNISQTTMYLTWNAAQDNIGVIGYQLYQVTPSGDKLLARTTSLSYYLSDLNPNTTYRYKIKAMDTQNVSEFSDVLSVKTLSEDSLDGYCDSRGERNSDFSFISRVQLGEIDNKSEGSLPDTEDGYFDYTPYQTTTLVIGETNTMKVSRRGWSDAGYGFIAWIDYNQDGDFEDKGEEIFRLWKEDFEISANFVVPADAKKGNTRMRVSADQGSFPGPCSIFDGGEVEDYMVVIGTKNDVEPTCDDGIQNGDETGIDCGGSCKPCEVAVDGGEVTTSDDKTEVTTITGDGIADVIAFKNTSTSNATYRYLITDDTGKILATETSSHDFEGASAGVCRVYGISFNGELSVTNKNISDTALATSGFEISKNYITVIREEDTLNPTCNDGIQNGDETGIDCGGSCKPCEVALDGGEVTTSDDKTEVTTITGDGIADVIAFKNTSTSNATYRYLITDDTGKILATETSSHDFEGASVGICRVYGISFNGELSVTNKNISDTGLATSGFEISKNYITVIREEDTPDPTCDDGIQNGDETGVDCGGSCKPCTTLEYCESGSENSGEDYISNFSLGSINKNSEGKSYSDFTSESTNLNLGSKASFIITPTWSGTIYNEAYGIWIDYNQDGDFEDPEEQVFSKAASRDTSITGEFTVPSDAKDGATRLRVIMRYNTVPSPCGSFNYGEAEDYTVNIGGVVDPDPTCDDGIQNGDETGIDCGGSCAPCDTSGTIVYVDNDDITTSSSSTWNFFRIEKGDDRSYGAWYNGNSIYLVTYNKGIVTTNGNGNQIVLLSEGVEVGASSNFSTDSSSNVIASNTYTDNKGKSGYIGISFELDGNTHYGWFYIEVSEDGLSYTILDYAYNTTAGQGLITTRNTSLKGDVNAIKKVKIYPNPFQQDTTLDVSDFEQETFTITVYSVLGKELYKKYYNQNPQKIKIDQSILSDVGYYLVKFTSEKATQTYAIIKK
ncbi:GEVED domain-containing protein [Aquimarina sp. 2201CG1-2-11]|uniref:GEVED domain-containing protein n=1 Tax=Aquimarina discodermiae TaxID=3231043 RepID=UPI003462BD57